VGRETLYEYDTNEIDLLNVKQKNPQSPGGYDLLTTYTYNSNHQPLTVTDTAGQTTTYAYNTDGQLATITTPERAGITEDRTTTYTYDEDGNLETAEAPVDVTVSYTYDSYGRIRTVTDPDEYVLTYDYDELGRLTKVTYPDSTFAETVYLRLDPVRTRDRLGRWTQHTYDALRRVTATTDPLRRTVTQLWCSCGSKDALIDANGNRTDWERDIQGRVVKETRVNGSQWVYEYEQSTSRLKKETDPKDQVKTFDYSIDDQLQEITYTSEEYETPDVSFTFDAFFDRLTTMADGTGTTTYAYYPIGETPGLGAGRLASIDGPLGNDTITYAYDELGRVVERSINTVSVTYKYDALARVAEETNALGTFTYGWDGTRRLEEVSYPNGQISTYSYYNNSGDRRLQEIHHKRADATTISRFDYTYDAVGNITAWIQQHDANAEKAYAFDYDSADQLRAAIWRTTETTPTILARYTYTYDPTGNRTVEQIDDAPMLSTYDNMNRITSQNPGGAIRFAGMLDETGTVTIDGLPATVASDNHFEGSVPVSSGTSEVIVEATDYSGNERTNTYEVSVTGGTKSYAFDENGNLTSDGTRDFEWDAENRLLAVNEGTHRSEFAYDGYGHRVQIVEKDNGQTLSDQKTLWCGWEICEERASDGTTIVRRFFRAGVEENGEFLFLFSDHLGSTRDVTDNAGAVRARYHYDPFGRMSKLSGDLDVPSTFTGYYDHASSGLLLAPRRPYDPETGQFLSEDPARSEYNAYIYVNNNPVAWADHLGLYKTRMDAALAFLRDNWAKSQREQMEICARICLCSDGSFTLGPTTLGPKGYEQCEPGPCPDDTTYDGRVHTHWLLGKDVFWGPPYSNDSLSPWDIEIARRDGVPTFLGNPSRELRRWVPPRGPEENLGDIFELLQK